MVGVETAVTAARVAVSSATRSAFRHGLAQTFTPPPPPDFPLLSPPQAHTGRPGPNPSPLRIEALNVLCLGVRRGAPTAVQR